MSALRGWSALLWSRERRALDVLDREAKRLGIGVTHAVPGLPGAGRLNVAWDGDVPATGVIRYDPLQPEPVFTVAHEIGHWLQCRRDPVAYQTWVRAKRVLVHARMTLSMENEAWDLAEALMKRLGLRFSPARLARDRADALASHRRLLEEVERSTKKGGRDAR